MKISEYKNLIIENKIEFYTQKVILCGLNHIFYFCLAIDQTKMNYGLLLMVSFQYYSMNQQYSCNEEQACMFSRCSIKSRNPSSVVQRIQTGVAAGEELYQCEVKENDVMSGREMR